MGIRSEYPGVEEHRGTLRIRFTYKGTRVAESLSWTPTPTNWARAAKMRAEIVQKIRLGTFNYPTYFPGRDPAQHGVKTFSRVAQEWLELQVDLAESTRESYRQALNKHWIPKLGTSHITDITPGDLKRQVIACNFKSDKTRNNCVSALRMVFEYALGERYFFQNPATGLEHVQVKKDPPDPFSVDEMRAILQWMKERSPAQMHNYFWFAFFSGLRTSELIQLQWENVDLRTGIVRVSEAKVRSQVKGTKTNRDRDVELGIESIAALTAQKAHTHLAGKHVFLNERTGHPYYNQQAPWLTMRAALKSLGIRHRPAYNTRHTYATMNLMAGANPYWVSKQLGHASLEMTLSTYATWIKNADSGRERSKLEAFLEMGAKIGGKQGVIGGKDG